MSGSGSDSGTRLALGEKHCIHTFLIKADTNIVIAGGQINVNWVDIRDQTSSMMIYAHELGHNLGIRFFLQQLINVV